MATLAIFKSGQFRSKVANWPNFGWLVMTNCVKNVSRWPKKWPIARVLPTFKNKSGHTFLPDTTGVFVKSGQLPTLFLIYYRKKFLYIINRKLPGQMANSQILIFSPNSACAFARAFLFRPKLIKELKKNEIYKPYYEERVTHALSLLLVDF